ESALESDIDLLNKTNRHVLSYSGKMIRPLLTLLSADACSGSGPSEDSCRYAAAAELLHNATLMHDDVVDNSDRRRGKPTLKSIMGPSVSVLVGDYWLVKAMEKIMDSDHASTTVIRLFSDTLSHLAEGELLQLQKAGNCDTDEDDYTRIIFCKTASLFEAAAVSGAISVDADDEKKEAIRTYAKCTGLAFQIKDDIFDYSGEDNKIGKPAGVD
ncbi:polyprenyl synthetase, partial [gut metagenome]